MRAAEISAYGEPPVVTERPEPQGAQRVLAAGLNPIDLRIASGTLAGRRPDLPHVPGSEAIFEIDGRRAYADASGAFAEYAVPTDPIDVPDGVETGMALAFGIAGLASWLALESRAQVQPGEKVLILGATGMVGLIAVQAAKLLGAGRVIAAGRDPEALERTREHGADAVVRLTDDLTPEVLRAAAEGDLDVVLDPLWGRPAEVATESLGFRGRLVNLGQSAGATATLPSATIRFRELAIMGHTNFAAPPEIRREALEKMFRHAASGELRAPYEEVPLEDVADAWRRQAESPNTKLVIVP
jgi:NADPH2:quinone reductase